MVCYLLEYYIGFDAAEIHSAAATFFTHSRPPLTPGLDLGQLTSDSLSSAEHFCVCLLESTAAHPGWHLNSPLLLLIPKSFWMLVQIMQNEDAKRKKNKVWELALLHQLHTHHIWNIHRCMILLEATTAAGLNNKHLLVTSYPQNKQIQRTLESLFPSRIHTSGRQRQINKREMKPGLVSLNTHRLPSHISRTSLPNRPF